VLLVASSANASDLHNLYGATELNHVTIRVSDLAVMKEDNELCYLKSDRGFLCLWQAGNVPAGFDHFCFGIPGFDRAVGKSNLSAERLALRRDADDPETVYVLDPEKITVQLERAGYAG
jgi:hypothetical protein